MGDREPRGDRRHSGSRQRACLDRRHPDAAVARELEAVVGAIAALKLTMVVPGHFVTDADGGLPFTLAAVRFTRGYLDAFEAVAAKARSSAELIAAMKRRYPGIPAEASLENSAKVMKDEMKWPA